MKGSAEDFLAGQRLFSSLKHQNKNARNCPYSYRFIVFLQMHVEWGSFWLNYEKNISASLQWAITDLTDGLNSFIGILNMVLILS